MFLPMQGSDSRRRQAICAGAEDNGSIEMSLPL